MNAASRNVRQFLLSFAVTAFWGSASAGAPPAQLASGFLTKPIQEYEQALSAPSPMSGSAGLMRLEWLEFGCYLNWFRSKEDVWHLLLPDEVATWLDGDSVRKLLRFRRTFGDNHVGDAEIEALRLVGRRKLDAAPFQGLIRAEIVTVEIAFRQSSGQKRVSATFTSEDYWGLDKNGQLVWMPMQLMEVGHRSVILSRQSEGACTESPKFEKG